MSHQGFTSRGGLIKNLGQHLLRGEWAAMIGGPLIGKTTLASNCADLLHNDQCRGILVSPKKVKSPSVLISQINEKPEKVTSEDASRKRILLIDDCDYLLQWSEALILEIVALSKNGPALHAICWIGGPLWGDWVKAHADVFQKPLRLYPLSVIPIREARAIILKQLGPSALEQVWHQTGGHPFLIETYFAEKNSLSIDLFRKRLWQEVRPEEEVILSQLDPEGGWMALEALRDSEGLCPEKALLDRLCMIGFIVRTLDEGAAVVRLTAPMLNKAKNKS